jgi:hypothetical protein
MANSFKTSSGNKSFGAFSESNDAGDYISKKKARASFCVANNCVPAVKVGTQSNLLLFNKSNKLSLYPCKNSINKANLNINLITQLDLSGVSVILDETNNATPCSINGINSEILPYLTYNIDPDSELFGNTICGINNYVNYMVYTNPNSQVISTQSAPYVINGGTFSISYDASYSNIITFTNTNNRTSNITFNKSVSVYYLIVGGGGGGGGGGGDGANSGGGGGGGGQVVFNTSPVDVSPGSIYTIAIGQGGYGGSVSINGNSGTASQIIGPSINKTSAGGYGGIGNLNYLASINYCYGGTNGSGSGSGKGGQLNATDASGNSGTNGGGGGGGAYNKGNGGNGGLVSIASLPSYASNFAAGGGGGSYNGNYGAGGSINAGNGGGLDSSSAYSKSTSAVANTGCGGGGGGQGSSLGNTGENYSGGNGGSGVVLLYFN